MDERNWDVSFSFTLLRLHICILWKAISYTRGTLSKGWALMVKTVNDRDSNPGGGQDISDTSRPAPRSAVPGSLTQVQSDQVMALNTHTHPSLRLKKEQSYNSTSRLSLQGLFLLFLVYFFSFKSSIPLCLSSTLTLYVAHTLCLWISRDSHNKVELFPSTTHLFRFAIWTAS
jgi:hypothetical protein